MVVTALNSMRSIPDCKVDYPSTLETAIVMEENTTRKSAAGMVATAFNSMRSIPTAIVEEIALASMQHVQVAIDDPSFIGDGDCDGGEYNTEECGWDGGDCIEFNEKYPNCKVDDPLFIGDGEL